MLLIAVIAFPLSGAWVADELDHLESGGAERVAIWAPLGSIYEHFGYWPTVIFLPALGLVCCLVFIYKIRTLTTPVLSPPPRELVVWRRQPDGAFLFRGRSGTPTPSQLEIWQQIQARLPELMEQARASIPTPEICDDPMGQFSRDEAQLKEIRLEYDGAIEFFFSPMIDDAEGYPLSPMVTFRDWKITESYWTP